jgi:hypothetical protein
VIFDQEALDNLWMMGAQKYCYLNEGMLGLVRDKTRPSRIAPLSAEKKLAIVEKTASLPTRIGAHANGQCRRRQPSQRATCVGRPQAASRAPFRLSNDPKFAEKVVDVVGLYIQCNIEAVRVDQIGRRHPP